MPGANRYFSPGQVYHLTHRCHDHRSLFKFARGRQQLTIKSAESFWTLKESAAPCGSLLEGQDAMQWCL